MRSFLGPITRLVCLFFAISSPVYGDTAQQILAKMDQARQYQSAQMDATMQIIDRQGGKTAMGLTLFDQKEGNKSLMRFTHPARLKGTAILTVGDNIWYYNKRTNRVRLLSQSAKKGSMMGSSFSYDDMSANYQKEFTATIASQTESTIILKMRPKAKDKSFSYLLATINKTNFIATQMDYYNQSEKKYKQLVAADIGQVAGNFVAYKVTMTDLASQKTTIFEIKKDTVKHDIPLPANLFSEQRLKR